VFASRFSASIGMVGVDIGTRAIKLLQLREHGGRLAVVGAGRIDLNPETPPDSETLRELLRGAFGSGGFTGRRCVVSLPRNDVRVQSVRLPRMPDDELRRAAVWEASQRFGFERDAMQADVIRTGAELQGAESRDEVLLIATAHVSINRCMEPLVASGLRPAAIETHFTALARVLGQPTATAISPRVAAVVDIGASGSTVMILRGDQIAFCKPINIGGNQFDRAVAEHLQMDLDAAGELRASRIAAPSGGATSEPIVDPSIERAGYDAVRPLLGNFAREVNLCIRYFGVTFRGHPPDRIILTGGDGLEPRLGETLETQCKIPVTFEDEDETLSGLIGGIRTSLQRDPGPMATWAVAAGLSLRGLSQSRLSRIHGPRREAA
jgi:type IV pilus assembly protein PilM